VNPRIFRAFRVFRILKLLQGSKGLQDLLQTLRYLSTTTKIRHLYCIDLSFFFCSFHRFALPALTNVGFLLAVFFFLYAVAGMNLWGKLKTGTYLDEHYNFKTFLSSVVVLFTSTTGENWNGIMRDCMVEPPFCDTIAGDCGSPGQVHCITVIAPSPLLVVDVYYFVLTHIGCSILVNI
jgi:hypothetical protein